MHHRDAFTLAVAGEPAPTLVDGDHVLRSMVSWIRLVGPRVVVADVADADIVADIGPNVVNAGTTLRLTCASLAPSLPSLSAHMALLMPA